MPVRGGGGGRAEGIPALTGVAEALAKILFWEPKQMEEL